jgi:hypothetical protein
MVNSIVFNSSNIINTDGYANTLVYKFPNSVGFPNHEIAVQSVSMFYSWGNINAQVYSNNIFTYTWTSGATTTTYQVNIPNGLYEIIDINSFLQFTMIQNGTYLINSTGQYVYYAEMVVNPNRYAVQVNTFPVPASLPAGYTAPANFAGFPTTANTHPVLVFPPNFNKIVGYAPNFSTTNPDISPTPTSYLSSVAPQVQPNPSIYLAISNIANKYAVPSSIIYSISPAVAFGEQIIDTPPQFGWNKLLAGTYNELRIQLLGQDLQPLPILDPNMTILLCLRDIKDGGAGELLDRIGGGKH